MNRVRILVLVAFFLAATTAGSDPGSDPAPGDSFLEQIFAKDGFPTNFIDLVGANQFGRSGQLPFRVLDSLQIPDSRSLQRSNVDFESPRVIAAVDSSAGDLPPSFIGYADKTHSAEMISWNPKKKQYDFLLVSDVTPGVQPKIVPADRKVCIACHQNEGPIFSHFPWSETSFNSTIHHKIDEARIKERLPVIATFNGAFTFDDSVRKANRALQAARICKGLCGDDLKCKRALLAEAIIEASIQTGAAISVRKSRPQEISSRLSSHWPKDNYRYPSSVLPDRNPLNDPSHGGTTTIFVDPKDDRIFFGDQDNLENPTYDESQSTNGIPQLLDKKSPPRNLFSSFTPVDPKTLQITGIRSLADPRTPRPKVSALFPDSLGKASFRQVSQVASVCFGFDQSDLVNLVNLGDGPIDTALNDPRLDEALKNWPPRKEDVLPILLSPNISTQGTGKDDLAAINCILRKTPESAPLANQQANFEKLNAEILAQLAPKPLNRDRVVQNFAKYCTQCHAPDTYKDTSEHLLPLTNLDELKKYVGGMGPVKTYLLEKMMPPQDLTKKIPEADERNEMIRALEQ